MKATEPVRDEILLSFFPVKQLGDSALGKTTDDFTFAV